jgi:hypothetical protein
MRRNSAIQRRRLNIASAFLLGMLLLRAYVPVGFMPASGAPFLLELCPAAGALPMEMAVDAHEDMPMDPHMDMSQGMDMPNETDMANGRDMSLGVAHGSHQHGHFDQCPFGSAPAAGPWSQFLAFEPAGFAPSFIAVDSQGTRPSQRPRRAHPPRGPPALA